MNSTLLLLQPRHVYAPDSDQPGHLYMPTSLLTAVARLQAAGSRVSFVDENYTRCSEFPEVIGINLVGAPYIPAVNSIASRARGQVQRIILGGQVITGLGATSFGRLFGAEARNGNDDAQLAAALEIDEGALPQPEATSLISAYEQVPDELMKLYLSSEFGFYLSQGCKYSCSFCAADRSRAGFTVRERYRDMQIVESDLKYLLARAARLGVRNLNLYLSNLDLFQSPIQLKEFSSCLGNVLEQEATVSLRFRALSNVSSFLAVAHDDPDLVATLVSRGLYRLGFGIDGATPAIWRATRKPLATLTDGVHSCEHAFRLARQFGITPEALMVFGHNDCDTEESLTNAQYFVSMMADRYGALSRPHVAKDCVPGNDGWKAPRNATTVEFLLTNPEYFQALDFTALPSPITHPSAEFRKLVSFHYIAICNLPTSVTQYILPMSPEQSPAERLRCTEHNLCRYDL